MLYYLCMYLSICLIDKIKETSMRLGDEGVGTRALKRRGERTGEIVSPLELKFEL